MRKITHKLRNLPRGTHVYKLGDDWYGEIRNKYGECKPIKAPEFITLIDRLLILTRRNNLKGEE